MTRRYWFARRRADGAGESGMIGNFRPVSWEGWACTAVFGALVISGFASLSMLTKNSFLDEIGNIPMELQKKLLTVLQRREVTRVGDVEARPVDIRLVCATNEPIYDRTELAAGNEISGPAIVVEDDSTVVVQPAYTATVDPYANLEITRGETQ